MDIALYMKVLWRHWKLVLPGIVVAAVLAVISFVHVDFDGWRPTLDHRQDEVWVSASTLFVTQEGFPWGRSILDDVIPVDGESGYIPRYGDPGRYAGLAQLYAALARSDAVQRQVLSRSPAGAGYEADVVKSADQSTVLPLIYMKGFGPSPRAAETIADRAADTFRAYLARQQAQNEIPPNRRVQVTLISRASQAELFVGRSLTRPVFVFLLVVIVFVTLAFVAENAGFRMPRPPAWTGKGDDAPVGVTPRAADHLATSMAHPAESPTAAMAPPAEPRTIGEPRRAAPAPAAEAPAEEPPARVQRWA